MRQVINLFLLGTFLLGNYPVSAHQDVAFDLQPDGTIEGIPEEFLPATLIISRDSNSPSMTLTLSGMENELHSCIAEIFHQYSDERIFMHGSWYHDLSGLPPYLVLEMPKQMKGGDVISPYSVIFDMRNGRELDLSAPAPAFDEEVVTKYVNHQNGIRPAYMELCDSFN